MGFESPKFEQREEKAEVKMPKRQKGLKKVIAKALLGASLIAGPGAGAAPAQEAPRQKIEMKESQKEMLASKYRKNFESFREAVRLENTRKKLDYLKGKYGGAMSSFTAMHVIDRDLEFLKKVEEGKQDPNTFVEEDFPYAMTPGSIVSAAYESRWAKRDIPNGEIFIEGVEGIPGLSEDRVQRELERYPQSYIRKSISGVKFSPAPEVRDDLIVLGRSEGFDFNSMIKGNERRLIEIYNTPDGMAGEEFLDVLRHEVHHPNDWQNSRVLTSAERINMLYDITARVESEDRFMSPYVESITAEEAARRLSELPPGTTPEQAALFARATEYWPEIAKEYFKDPEKFQKEHPRDYEVVSKWVRVLSAGVVAN